jgi:hypothetical protein
MLEVCEVLMNTGQSMRVLQEVEVGIAGGEGCQPVFVQI